MSNTDTLDKFTRAYIEAALWSTRNESSFDSEGHLKKGCAEFLDADFSAEDFTPKALTRIVADCLMFQAENPTPEYLSDPRYSDEEKAGHDFWLTRNHHGAGFWDRGLGEVGEKLTRAAHAYGEVDIYVTAEEKLDF